MRLSLEGVEHGPAALREVFGRIGVTSSRSALELQEHLGLAEINDVLEYLYYACEITLRPSELKKQRNLLLSPFSTGFTFGPCGSPQGRYAALQRSLKRALLLSKRVVLPNPFAYSRAEPFSVDTDIARMNLATLLNHVYNCLPLLEDGFIGFFPNCLTVCEDHKKLIDNEETRIHERLMSVQTELTDSLLRGVEAALKIDKAGYYYIRFTGEHPLMNPGGAMDLVFGEGAVPEEMKARVGEPLGRADLLRFGNLVPILDRIEHLTFLFSSSAHFCGLDLLATDIVEIDALSAANVHSVGRDTGSHFAVSDFGVPDFSRLSLRALMRLAQREEDSLDRFREAFKNLLDKINLDGPYLSPRERSQLIQERLVAERETLNKRLVSRRKKALRNAMEQVVVGGLSLGMGLFTGLAGSAAAAFQAFGGLSMTKGVADAVADSLRIPEDIEADSWYFLWKLGKARR